MADNPRNTSQVSRDVKEIKAMVSNVITTQTKQGEAIEGLQQWRLSTEAAREAVEKYKSDEAQTRRDRDSTKFINSKSEILKTLVPLLVALTALVYAYTQRIH